MVHCQRLHQVDSTEVSLGLTLFIANELDDRRDCGVIKSYIGHYLERFHISLRKAPVYQKRKKKMQVKQGDCYIILYYTVTEQ